MTAHTQALDDLERMLTTARDGEAVGMMRIQEYHAREGRVVMASVKRLPLGQVEELDWNEEYMTKFRWSVVGDATKDDLSSQNAALGDPCQIDPRFRFFYKIVAMD